ncbi:LysB family phage lysis regulatory protein [Pseudomonas laurylsulfatiphila]
MPSLSSPLAFALIACMALVGVQQYRLKAAEASHASAQLVDANDRADRADQQLKVIRENATDRDRASADLRDLLADLRRSNQQSKELFERLTRENKDFRDWAAAELPDAAISLRTRPEIVGAGQYRAWLSARNRMPITVEPSDKQRRASAHP